MLPKLSPDFTGMVNDAENHALTRQLSDSWQRSQHYGLHRSDHCSAFASAALLKEQRDHNHWVVQRLQPLLERYCAAWHRQPTIMVISDASGLILETYGNNRFLHQASHLSLSPGNEWSEQQRGTNAIGTALALGEWCEVNGSEHYLQRNAALWCSAAPIYLPDGHIAGVLDISTPVQTPYFNARSTLLQVIRHVEHHWVTSTVSSGNWVLRLHQDYRILGTVHELVLVFSDERLISANRLAMQEFQLTPASLGATSLTHLFPALPRHPLQIPHLAVATNNRQYYAQWDKPVRHSPRLTAQELEQQKALRILNAGLSLSITGETGCGKEHFSRCLYQQSKWHKGQFVAINCAALPESLIESELFGYAPGAFTGAHPKGYAGKIREADGGVLFLDEIGDMPLSIQARLLRVLQEKTVTPLGSREAYKVDFALICATHRSLSQLVAEGVFREDLLYRIQEFSICITPLRHRPQRDRFIQHLWSELGADQRGISLTPEVMAVLVCHPWPGNVRQLLSTLKVLLALAEDHAVITVNDLPAQLQLPPQPIESTLNVYRSPQTLLDAIEHANGNVSLAAKNLGISRSTLYRQMAKNRQPR
ncbi:sigma-54-dependent Fis family transcriptional regulator [Serratia sp. NPDC078593]|uniref:sigma-54-dependent Fis family transcriptional regulator n=1 Tax=unclassified Serratia (in: enterobacteria) TaxID=2647522 RepID=UPI0037D01295